MTLSTSFRSIVRGRQLPQVDQAEIRRLISYRDSCAPAEVSFPATVLHDAGVARWLRDQRFAIDVRTLPELYSAIAAGIHPVLMTVHVEQFDRQDIRRVGATGAARVVLSCSEHIASLGAEKAGRTQNVLLRMADAATGDRQQFIFDSKEADGAVDAVMARRSAALIGLHCDVGTAVEDFISYPAAIGNMIAQMDHIRRRHGVVLTRLILGGGKALTDSDSSAVRRDLAEEIDRAVDDACATLRFPRPVIVMSAGGPDPSVPF
ncbi:type III PLP-dependent enzyme domain-containing protein [Mycolicibacterium sarraceniae]|uniref:LysA protein n=1 Tax=Mycolicibacterium sarraceniae TaxID=1534348 RepID=A0A7I7SLW5_9MYCO|nr:LysA protein [Mycolicibacterium sarraceniae]BBY57520.1 LysA protein [Mycolicibacterium sarraceniae]